MLHGEFEVSLGPHSKILSLKYSKNITLTQYILLGFTCVSVFACMFVYHVCPGSCGGHKWALDTLELGVLDGCNLP